MNARSRFSKGQMMAAFTIVLPVLIGVMALGADFAIIYLNWSMVQKAADAAALAGASQLTAVPGSAATLKPNVVNYVDGYACLNGIKNGTSTLCTAAASPAGYADNIVFTTVTDTQVSVGIHRSVPYSFGKMIGLQEAAVAAKATAAIEAAGTVSSGMFPVGLQCNAPCSTLTLDPPQSVSFGAKFVGGLAPGNWDWLALGEKGAKSLGAAIQNGASGSFSIGDLISTEPGNKGNAGPVKKGFDARMANCGSTTSVTDPCQNGALIGGTNGIGGTSGLSATDPCLVTVPAVDFTGVHGRKNMPIEAFAQIYIEPGTSDSGTINGCFVQQVAPSTSGSASAPNLGSLAPPVLIN
jgi:hypothetical protein